MHVGIQLFAPNGFDVMVQDHIYHLAVNDHKRVLLVDFGATVSTQAEQSRNPVPQMACLSIMSALRFEEALLDGRIMTAPVQLSLPPWLAAIEGFDIEAIDRLRMTRSQVNDVRDQQEGNAARRKIHSHFERVAHREKSLADALRHTREILASSNPDAEINCYARRANPRQNETRFRRQFWVKICFPASPWALLPPYCGIGHWNRSSPEHLGTKLGRPSKGLGALHGAICRDPELIKRIEDAYLRHSDQGKTMSAIYHRAMIEHFGCLGKASGRRRGPLFHPEGLPFPTLNEFTYRCVKAFGREQIRLNLWGDKRVRNRIAPSKGRYSQAVANLMETVGIDVAVIDGIPQGLDEQTELPPLRIAEMVCEATGMIVGIGFTLGSESSRTYRAAMFCAAIDKRKFCSLFGLSIEDHEWPSMGLPAVYTSDRGPGAKPWADRGSDSEPAIRSMPPSYTPQSNATVESAHARKVHPQGGPTRVVSRLNPVEMARREIFRVIAQNHTRDVTERLTPEMFAEGVAASPIGMWDYLDQRCRTVAQHVAFDEAVRSYLDQVNFTCADGAVTLHGQRFSSVELQQWLSCCGERVVKGYVLDLCVRYAWVDTGSGIIEVEAQLPLRDDESQLFLSLPELQQLEGLRHRARNDQAWSKHAHAVHYKDRCLREVGEIWSDGKRKAGRARPRAKAAREAAAEFQRHRPRGSE